MMPSASSAVLRLRPASIAFVRVFVTLSGFVSVVNGLLQLGPDAGSISKWIGAVLVALGLASWFLVYRLRRPGRILFGVTLALMAAIVAVRLVQFYAFRSPAILGSLLLPALVMWRLWPRNGKSGSRPLPEEWESRRNLGMRPNVLSESCIGCSLDRRRRHHCWSSRRHRGCGTGLCHSAVRVSPAGGGRADLPGPIGQLGTGCPAYGLCACDRRNRTCLFCVCAEKARCDAGVLPWRRRAQHGRVPRDGKGALREIRYRDFSHRYARTRFVRGQARRRSEQDTNVEGYENRRRLRPQSYPTLPEYVGGHSSGAGLVLNSSS